jgi:hypothetical protein
MTSLFTDEFYHTLKSEAYEKSQYLMHEHSIARLFHSMLFNLGYRSNDSKRYVWKNKEKTVVVCLSDSFAGNATFKFKPIEQQFDTSTVVITDNYTNFNPQYTVLRLPNSYFGIYNYVPESSEFCPTKRFGFSVNRLDLRRELILLELINQSGNVESWLQLDHVNFNCFDIDSNNHSVDDIKTNFLKHWAKIDRAHPTYDPLVQQLMEHLPIRNHQMTIEQAHVSVYLNLVVESYSDDNVIALSEKTFRALVTPAPWALFSGAGTVSWLTSLGFDVLSDIVDHEYNHVCQINAFHSIKKIQTYIASSIKIYEKLASMDPQQLKSRCEKAAAHNQQLLASMQQRWPQDFANWLPNAISEIAGK